MSCVRLLRQKTIWRVVDSERVRNPLGLSPGDVVLLRLNVDLGDGLSVPPAVAGRIRVSGLGETPATSRQVLPEWDRVCVAVDWGRNQQNQLVPPRLAKANRARDLEPCVAMAWEEHLEVVTAAQLMEDPKYAVIGIRKLSISNHAGLDGEAPPSPTDEAERGLHPLRRAEHGLHAPEDGDPPYHMEHGTPTSLLNEAVYQMRGHPWNTLTHQNTKANTWIAHRAASGNPSVQLIFERLRNWTANLHAESQLGNRQNALESIAEQAFQETDVTQFFHRQHAEENEEMQRSYMEDMHAKRALRHRLMGAVHTTHIVEDMADDPAYRCPTDEEWQQLIEHALCRKVTFEVAMRMQVYMCRDLELTITEAETALLVCAGGFDLGAPLCAEVTLHLVRSMEMSKVVDLGPCWVPSQFDDDEEGHNSRKLRDVLIDGVSYSNVRIVKHIDREFRGAQGRAKQSWDSLTDDIVGSIEELLPAELRAPRGVETGRLGL